MRFFVKNSGGNKAEAWIEDWLPGADDFQVTSRAKLIIAGDTCLIDTLDTPVKFRKRGYATTIVKNLMKEFKKVQPIAIQQSAKGFWDKFNMTDGLGEEQ